MFSVLSKELIFIFYLQGLSILRFQCQAAVNEPRREKTCLRDFRPGPTQIRLYNHRGWLEAWNFGFGKERDCTFQGAYQLRSYCAANLRLCFRIRKKQVSYDEAQI